MKPYGKFQPTGFDSEGAFLPDQSHWLVAPVSISRDSKLLELSNWKSQLAQLEEASGKEEDTTQWEIHRFGHWACGWFEILIVKPDTAAFKVADAIETSLMDYSILNEEDYCEREQEATLSAIQEQLRRIETTTDLPDTVSGDLFSWFWDNDQSAIESHDDQGGYPNDEQMAEGLTSLGFTIVKD